MVSFTWVLHGMLRIASDTMNVCCMLPHPKGLVQLYQFVCCCVLCSALGLCESHGLSLAGHNLISCRLLHHNDRERYTPIGPIYTQPGAMFTYTQASMADKSSVSSPVTLLLLLLQVSIIQQCLVRKSSRQLPKKKRK